VVDVFVIVVVVVVFIAIIIIIIIIISNKKWPEINYINEIMCIYCSIHVKEQNMFNDME